MNYLYNLEQSEQYLRSEIDSGGMQVVWTRKELADTFKTREEAIEFAARVLQHFPSARIGVESPDGA